MKTINTQIRNTVIAATALVVCVIAIWSWHLRRHSIPAEVEGSDRQATLGIRHQQPILRGDSGDRTNDRSSANDRRQSHAPITNMVSTQHGKSRQEQLEASVAAGNVPIVFWGRVIDQMASPIAGARVVLRCRTWRALAYTATANVTTVEMVSDESGYFQLSGLRGDTLTIVDVTKPGYLTAPGVKKTIAYANCPQIFIPDANAPEIIRMWKQTERGLTISRAGLFRVQPDGRAFTIDLINVRNVEGVSSPGDFVLRVNRPDVLIPRQKYPWTFAIEVPDGGITEALDEYLFEAPASGYASMVSVDMNPTNASWSSVFKKSYYIKSRGGRVYGSVKVTVEADYGAKSIMKTESVLNTNGWRNLTP